MSFSFSDFSAGLKAGTPIAPEDVLALRRLVWPDGVVSQAEADSILDLHRIAGNAPTEWADFVIESVTEFVVNGKTPHGYVDDADAAWLIGRLDGGDRPIGPVALELIVKILETALNAPASLKSWALTEIERCVLTGTGATRRDGDLRPGVVDEAEVELLRRIIFASGGEGALLVTEDEAEMLWRIKDAAAEADNAPGWKRLFVQGVGNFLTAYSSYRPLERAEAARLDAFMDDRRTSVLGFLGRMDHVDVKGAEAAFAHGRSAADHAAAVAAAEAVTPAENAWLQGRIDADGKYDAYEEALIAFLEEESGQKLH